MTDLVELRKRVTKFGAPSYLVNDLVRAIGELEAALKTSICPAGNQMVEDCIKDGCGCENGMLLEPELQLKGSSR